MRLVANAHLPLIPPCLPAEALADPVDAEAGRRRRSTASNRLLMTAFVPPPIGSVLVASILHVHNMNTISACGYEERPRMGLRIAIDTGGTFTDVVAIDEATGAITAVKTPSTPADPSIGLLDGVEKALAALGRPPEDLAMLLHGSTVATNAVLEHKFDGLGLIVTRGFRHMIEIARQSVPDGYGNSFFWVKPQRLVPLHLVREVPGRLRFDGSEIEPIDEEATLRGGQRTGRGRGQVHRRLPAPLLRQWRARSRRSATLIRKHYPGRLRLALLGRAAGVPRIRAGDDHARRRAGQALLQDLSAERGATRSARSSGDIPFLIMQSNGGVVKHADRRRTAGDHAPLRARGGHPRLDPHGRARRLPRHPHHRCRRHLDRCRDHRGPASRCTPRPRRSRATR